MTDVRQLLAAGEAARQARADAMPDERAALARMREAFQRLEELGFREIIYCPKDGTSFEAIVAGDLAPAECMYIGAWPDGAWFVWDAGDLYPANPILFRLKA